MIRIENLTIANYRSYKDQGNKVDKLKKINVLVGKNNVGKTNALRAIYLFFNPESYDIPVDRNMIKQMTGGQSEDPKITITFVDTEIESGKEHKYKIICDLNQKEKKQFYSVESSEEVVISKLGTNTKIKNYLAKKIKCVYLSTTDEDIAKQSEGLINDLILKYFKKQNKEIKNTIDAFEKTYDELIKTFENNIESIEKDLATQFVGMSDIGIVPKLSIDPTKEIANFLLENVKLQLDDSYAQDIGTKGAGVQRASLVMLSIYLLAQIYAKENKIILLDEPEAFLYPLLERKVKEKLEESVLHTDGMQIFMTSHSRTFLQEINNENYDFLYLRQEKEEKEYKRSKNDIDINKYTVIEVMNRHNKYEVLKNYGLLHSIDDYEYVIICEGETDKNYILKILEGREEIPQIRYGKYSEGITGSKTKLNYDYMGKGVSACLPILAYLDGISNVSRRVLVVLDGDGAGKEVLKKIKPKEYHNLEIKVISAPDGKEIEDVVFDKKVFARRVIQVTPELKELAKQYQSVIEKMDDSKSVIKQTEEFISGNGIQGADIYRIKNLISNGLDDVELRGEWLLSEVESFLYAD